MIVTRQKNQESAKQIIRQYLAENPDFGEITGSIELSRFIKYFAQQIMKRVAENDCYFIDLLNDVEMLNEYDIYERG